MFRALIIVAVMAAVIGVVLLRTRYASRLVPGGAESRFPRIEGLTARLCELTFVGLVITGFYDLLIHGRLMHTWILLIHVGLGGAFAAALAGIAFLRAEANAPATITVSPLVTVRKACFWIFVASGLALILTAALAMIPWLGTDGQHRIIAFHRWAALISVVAAIGYAGLVARRRLHKDKDAQVAPVLASGKRAK